MYATLPTFVLGFHGCDRSVAEAVLNGKEPLKASENDYDWLGNGIYFWENNPTRALEYADTLKAAPHRTKGKIQHPAVIGAVIDLGYCLNLLESKSLRVLKDAYISMASVFEKADAEMPKNRNVGDEMLLRPLDCAVIEFVHSVNRDEKRRSYDTVRGVYMEGPILYPGTDLREKNHIQICVRNPNCIKGFFLVREPEVGYSIP